MSALEGAVSIIGLCPHVKTTSLAGGCLFRKPAFAGETLFGDIFRYGDREVAFAGDEDAAG